MKNRGTTQFLIGFASIIVAFLFSVIAPDWFEGADRAMVRQMYRTRGERQIDSSVVILYLGNDDIASLGGLPLKRNYYALLISALHDVGAGAIGLDIALPEPDREHPEYDQVLSAVVKSTGNVVMSEYCSSFSTKPNGPDQPAPSNGYSISNNVSFPWGENFEIPFPELSGSAASFGHTNITDRIRIPVFINSRTHGTIPSFSLELLRIGLKLNREDIKVEDSDVRILLKGKTLTFPINNEGEAELNFCGGISSLSMMPVLRFLQEYDEWKSNSGSSGLVHPFKDKIVIIGIVAEGKSLFLQTPFDSQFPAAGIHSIMIDNILNETILQHPSVVMKWLFTLLCGLVATTLMFWRKQSIALLGILVFLVIGCSLSYLLFTSISYILPLSLPLFTLVVSTGSVLVYRQSLVQSKLLMVEEDQRNAELLLLEKEIRLKSLEQQLQNNRNTESPQPDSGLLDDIRKYRREIDSLRGQIDDFKPQTSAPGEPAPLENEFEGIVYSSSSPMAEVVSFIKKIAVTDASVLILGESGTGKELVARAIHNASGRKEKPFIAVNCGALTETLLESELFGHEKGAFTGAIKEKAGRFELANQGTIFLDEIAETSEAFQVKLLRVLQEGAFERVGGTETRKVNIRVLAATNRDIKQEVKQKNFREDLYYRLNVFVVSLPPLRARAGDIALLVNRFLKLEHSELAVSASVMNILLQHDWKGNVRELQSVLKHALVLARSEGRNMVRLKDLPKELASITSETIDLEEQIIESLRAKEFARNAISETAAELGGLNRGTVAEYFRGYCFKIFCESNWNVNVAAGIIARTEDAATKEKVQKKIEEYLRNGIDLVNKDQSLEDILTASKAKSKNLPQRYHPYLESLIRAYVEAKWSIAP